MFTGALQQYREVNDALPESILVYRDGVGDGQLDQVANHEVKQLLASFKEFRDINYE